MPAGQLLVQRAEPGRTWRRPGSSSTAQDRPGTAAQDRGGASGRPPGGSTPCEPLQGCTPSPRAMHLRCMSGCVESITHTRPECSERLVNLDLRGKEHWPGNQGFSSSHISYPLLHTDEADWRGVSLHADDVCLEELGKMKMMFA